MGLISYTGSGAHLHVYLPSRFQLIFMKLKLA